MVAKTNSRGPKIPQLTSVARCGCEIGKLYRAMRRRELDTMEGLRMVQALLALKSCLETGQIEQDMEQIKEALENRPSERTWPKLVS